MLSRESGISPFCYYGQLSRLAGADAVIFTSFGGRFSFSRETCTNICEGTNEKWPTSAPYSPFLPAA